MERSKIMPSKIPAAKVASLRCILICGAIFAGFAGGIAALIVLTQNSTNDTKTNNNPKKPAALHVKTYPMQSGNRRLQEGHATTITCGDDDLDISEHFTLLMNYVVGFEFMGATVLDDDDYGRQLINTSAGQRTTCKRKKSILPVGAVGGVLLEKFEDINDKLTKSVVDAWGHPGEDADIFMERLFHKSQLTYGCMSDDPIADYKSDTYNCGIHHMVINLGFSSKACSKLKERTGNFNGTNTSCSDTMYGGDECCGQVQALAGICGKVCEETKVIKIDVHETLREIDINGHTTVKFIVNTSAPLDAELKDHLIQNSSDVDLSNCKLTLPIDLVTSEMGTAAYRLPEATATVEMSVDAVVVNEWPPVEHIDPSEYESHLKQLGYKWSTVLERYIENSVNDSLCCKHQCCGYCDAYYVENAYGKNVAWTKHTGLSCYTRHMNVNCFQQPNITSHRAQGLQLGDAASACAALCDADPDCNAFVVGTDSTGCCPNDVGKCWLSTATSTDTSTCSQPDGYDTYMHADTCGVDFDTFSCDHNPSESRFFNSTTFSYTNDPKECKEAFGIQDFILDRTDPCLDKHDINRFFVNDQSPDETATSDDITTIDVC